MESDHKIRTGDYNKYVRKMNHLLRAGGGLKKGAGDQVDFKLI